MFKVRKEMTMAELVAEIKGYGLSIPLETVNKMTYSELRKLLRTIKSAWAKYEKAERLIEEKSQPKASKNTQKGIF